MTIQIGQRYRLNQNGSSFIAEVIEVLSSEKAKIKVVQLLGYPVSIGHVFNSEPVTNSYHYTYLEGQDAPSN